jgi:glycerophosphoryl diester phosphodiesterase
MKKLWRPLAFMAAIAFVVLSFVNASWLSEPPRGYLKLIAHRGVMQQFDHRGIDDATCTAARIEPPVHRFIENTIPGLQEAARNGAQMIEVDVAPTRDGRLALFHDSTLDCRSDGHGAVRDHTLAELRKLDAGWGYTADRGKTFPLRGLGVGLIPSLEDAWAAVPTTAFLYNFQGRDPAEAQRVVAALKAAGRDPVQRGDGFSGPEPVIAAIRGAFPGAWAYSPDSLEACTKAYIAKGWFGITPAACKNGTLAIPLNYQWAYAGWPNKLMARMTAVGARVIVVGDYGSGRAPMGLDLPEQIGEIPAAFTGYVWSDDIWAIGPALRPAYNKRTPPQEEAFAKALEARRQARE